MAVDQQRIEKELHTALVELLEYKALGPQHILVVGASTSEVIGVHIGKGGTLEVASALYKALKSVQDEHGFQLAFQSCEHLNRALVVERQTQERYGLTEVSAIPQPSAGGSMATYAYEHFHEPVLVEHIAADAGIDIGDTLIGMHLKHVAVPVRTSIKHIGEAHLTLAMTRPKLIGGERAKYRR